MEVYMKSVKAFKFMNGWVVKHKDIDKIEEAIWVDRATALEELYVYGWAVKAEMAYCLNYDKRIATLAKGKQTLIYMRGGMNLESIH